MIAASSCVLLLHIVFRFQGGAPTMDSRHGTLFAALALVFGCVPVASAQVFTGRIDITVEDGTGARLPGVAVDLAGPVNQTQVTDGQGQAHFLSLNVGTYSLRASLAGFTAYLNAEVIVQAGAATPVLARLGVAG